MVFAAIGFLLLNLEVNNESKSNISHTKLACFADDALTMTTITTSAEQCSEDFNTHQTPVADDQLPIVTEDKT